jgi:hypothetical protein
MKCGYNKEVFSEQEICDNNYCGLCNEKMILDMNKGKKIEEKPVGDNFPIINKGNNYEQEIINNVRIIGEYSTWNVIEEITDAKLRIKYRMAFLKLGYKIPEKEL